MTTAKATVLLLLFAASCPLRAQGWSIPDSSFSAIRIDDIFFVNPDTGWAAAYSNIFKTTDGGQSWTLQKSTGFYLRSIEFLDGQTGFCGTLDGVFYKTTDGGSTWTDISPAISPPPPGVCGISHAGGQRVYASGIWSSPAYVLKSDDGGESWASLDLSGHASALVDVHFFSQDSGFVTGQDAEGGVILFTGDGGATWEQVHNTGVSGEYVWKIQMLARDTLVASIENFGSTGHILLSHDGGKNWFPKTFPASGDIQGIAFTSAQKGWVGGYFSGIYETLDGGETWEDLGTGSSVNRFFVLNDSLAYASGHSIYKYEGCSLPPVETPPLPPGEVNWSVRPAGGGGGNFVIEVCLASTDNVDLGAYSLDGRLLQKLFNGRLPPGTHVFEKRLNCPAGLHLVGLQTNGGMSTRKVVVVH